MENWKKKKKVWRLMAQQVERPTLEGGLGHDPRVVRSSPVSGSVLTGRRLLGILSLLLSLPLPTHTCPK